MTDTPFNDAAGKNAEKTTIGQEPEIALSDFYSGANDPRLTADLANLAQKADRFATRYKGKLAMLSAEDLASCLEDYDEITALTSKIGTFAFMPMAKNVNKYGDFYSGIAQKMMPYSNQLIFFTLELGKIPLATLEQGMAQSPRLARYRIVLEGAVAANSHRLSEDQEIVANIKDLTGAEWVHMFDKLMPNIPFEFEGKTVDETAITAIMAYDSDRSRREAAYKTFVGQLHNPLVSIPLTANTNALAMHNAEDDKLRGYKNPDSSRNQGENVSDAAIENLSAAVRAAYARTSHRFYEIKRRMLGYDALKPWDRNAALSTEAEAPLPYTEALATVIDAYASFAPELGARVKEFSDNGWIDARKTDGKRSGAFATGGVAFHPYMHISWTGSARDSSTLAHELGHNLQQDYSARTVKSEMMADMPMVLAEIPSTFGERILFEHKFAQEKDVTKRKLMLAEKLDDMMNTVVRQIAFHNFELRAHGGRREKGEPLTTEELDEIFMETQKEALGPAFDLGKDYGRLWSYIPHFVHSPFYVRAYAFSLLATNTIYKKYEQDKAATLPHYISFISKGGSETPAQALKAFGMDLDDPACWDAGLKVIEEFIDRLEAEIELENRLKKGGPSSAPKGPSAP